MNFVKEEGLLIEEIWCFFKVTIILGPAMNVQGKLSKRCFLAVMAFRMALGPK